MSIKSVVALRSKVNTSNETANDAAIMSGRFLSLFSPLTEPPIMIGSRGRTQGASTVNIPAMKAPNSKNILFPFELYALSYMVLPHLAGE